MVIVNNLNNILRLRSGVLNAGGNLVFAFFQWLQIALLARSDNKNDLGAYAFSIAITAPIFLFSFFQMRTIVATDTHQKNQLIDYFSARIFLTLIALIISILYAIFFLTGNLRWIFVLVAVSKAAEAISDFAYGVMQKNNKTDKIGYSLILRGTFSFILFFITWKIFDNSVISIAFSSVSWILCSILYDFRYFRQDLNMDHAILNIFKPNILDIVLKSFPLGVASILGSLIPNIPRYFMAYSGGLGPIGIYSAMFYFVFAGNSIIGALSNLVAPKLAFLWVNKNIKDFTSLLMKLVGISTIVGLISLGGVGFLGQYIIKFAYGAEYIHYKNTLLVFMIGAVANYINWMLNVSSIAIRSYWIQNISNLTTLLCIVIGCYFLVPLYSINGAAWAYSLASVVQVIFGASAISHVLRRVRNA